MGDWSAIGAGNRYSTEGEDSANTRGTLLANGGVANAKGNYTQIIASTPFDAQGFLLTAYANSNQDCLLDVAVGAATEQVIVPNFLLSFCMNNPTGVYFPIPIPASTRVTMRTQSGYASQNQYGQITLLSQGFLPGAPLGRVEAWGADTTDSGGTSVDPGGTAHTKGLYSQLIASTAFDVRAVIIVIGGGGTRYRPTYRWLVDIAVGAATEQIILPDIGFGAEGASNFYGDIQPKTVGPLPVHIPAGTRVAARAQCNDLNAAYRVFDIAIYGIG